MEGFGGDEAKKIIKKDEKVPPVKDPKIPADPKKVIADVANKKPGEKIAPELESEK